MFYVFRLYQTRYGPTAHTPINRYSYGVKSPHSISKKQPKSDQNFHPERTCPHRIQAKADRRVSALLQAGQEFLLPAAQAPSTAYQELRPCTQQAQRRTNRRHHLPPQRRSSLLILRIYAYSLSYRFFSAIYRRKGCPHKSSLHSYLMMFTTFHYFADFLSIKRIWPSALRRVARSAYDTSCTARSSFAAIADAVAADSPSTINTGSMRIEPKAV